MNKKIIFKSLYSFSLIMISLGFILLIFDCNINIDEIVNKNSNNGVSIENIKSFYDNMKPVFYDDFSSAVENSINHPTSFKGKLTHYGPDCELCGGHTSCNGQDVRNGNIYYEDPEYGKLRIVATSTLIPCGSIIRINIPAYDNMYVIALDRGVSGNVIDLLKESQVTYSPVGTTSNVIFDIVRYGY